MSRVLFNKLFDLIKVLELYGEVSVIDDEYSYYDEPHFNAYTVMLNPLPKYLNKNYSVNSVNQVVGGGCSFDSKETALVKAVGEAIERMCLYSYPEKIKIHKPYNSLVSEALDPSVYKKNSKSKLFDWIQGEKIGTNKKILIPAQLIYLPNGKHKEDMLFPRVSTGAAGGFSKNSAILRGIYEVIERDAFMCAYLGKIAVPKINLGLIDDKRASWFTEKLSKYRLEAHVFDITNNLEVPTYLSIILDNSFSGPFLIVAAKADLNYKDALFGSLEESIRIRLFIRNMMQNDNIVRNVHEIRTIDDRVGYWFSSDMIEKLDFLLDVKTSKPKEYKLFKNEEEEIEHMIQKLSKNSLNAYSVLISKNIIPDDKYVVYKVIIPGLQPLYLDERAKYVNSQRILEVVRHFGKKTFSVNTIPHPFL